MVSIKEELQAGWKDARWSFYFALALMPTVFVAVLLASLVDGGTGRAPSTLAWVLCVPAALLSLFWAGLKDGMDGRLGRYVWTLTLILVGYWLILILIRTHGTEKRTSIRIGKHRIIVAAALEPPSLDSSARLRFPRANIHWEDWVPS
jgi:hypothetical protein